LLKDERRAKEKIPTGKTRSIISAPLDYVIASRMYNLAFVSHFYQSRIKTFSAVGINCGSFEWDRLVRHLLSVGDHGFDGDYSSFDGTLMASYILRIPEIISQWYQDSFLPQRYTLMHEIAFCLHQYHHIQYMTHGGNSTGGDMTVVINTILNECYLRSVWMTVMPNQWKDLYHYRRFVRSAAYGDDGAVAIDRFFQPYFNAAIVEQKLKEHGITYTTAAKQQVTSELRPVPELQFLKRTSAQLQNVFVPIFDEPSNFETTNWIRKCDDEEAASEDNCNCVLRNAFFAGSKYFNTVRNVILHKRPEYNLLQYDTLYNEFFSCGFVSDPNNDYGFSRISNRLPLDNHHYLLDDRQVPMQ